VFNKNITAICLFFILTAHSTAYGDSYAVDVIPPGPRLVSPRALATLPFSIKNIGSVKDTFDLAVDLPEGWTSISSLNPVTLKPGQRKKKLITVSVPPTALSNISYSVKFIVTSKGDAMVATTASAELQVKGVLGLRLTPEPYPKIAWAGETVTYGFEIRNLGNGDDIFEIEAYSSLKWKIKTSQDRLELAPYKKGIVQVSLKVPRDIKQEQLHMFSFSVSSVKAKEQDKDIEEETKLRLKVIPVVDKKGKTYLELPGSMEIEFAGIGAEANEMIETKLRFETSGDLTEEYYSRLYFNGIFSKEENEEVDYRFDLSKKKEWGLRLGHTLADFTRLTGDLSGEGISARTYGKKIETTMFAGRNYVESDDSEEDEEYAEYSVGANITALFGPKGRIGLTSMFMDKESSPGNKQLCSLSGEHQIFEPLTLSGEIAYGFENTDTSKKEDAAWFTRSELNWKKLWLSAEYYRGGTDYPGSITDEEGINIYSSYMLFEPFSLWLEYHLDNDNVVDDPANLTTKTETIRFGPQFRFGRWPTVDVTFEQEKIKNNEITDITAQDNVKDSISLGAYKSFKYFTLSAGGKWGKDKNSMENTRASTSEYNATASGYYKMFNWGMIYDRSDSRPEQAGDRTTTDKMTYELGCYLFNILRANIEYSDEVTRTNGSKTRSHAYDLELGLTKRIGIGKDQSLGLNFEWNNVTEDEEREWGIGLVWRWNFGMPVPWIKIKGRVRGQLFLDEDGNGIRGANEKVYPRTRVTLNRMQAYTDDKGIFEFPVLDPENYRLDMDTSQLPSGIIPAISLPRDISVKKGDNIFVDIPLEQVGIIQGTVFDDGNKNMQKDETEDGLSPIRLILLQKEKEIQETFTDQKGRYVLTDIKPGDYVVKIDTEYLPHRYIMTTPETIKVDVKSKEQIADINFGAYKKPRKIIKTFFKKKIDG
jgi:SdrD B-like domain